MGILSRFPGQLPVKDVATNNDDNRIVLALDMQLSLSEGGVYLYLTLDVSGSTGRGKCVSR